MRLLLHDGAFYHQYNQVNGDKGGVSSGTVDRQKLPRKRKKRLRKKETDEGEELMSPDSKRETGDKESWGYLSFRWSMLRRQSLFLIPEWTGVDRLILRAAGR